MDKQVIGNRTLYLPFMQGWRLSLGLKPLSPADWIEIDGDFAAQLQLKQSLLENCYTQVFVSLPESRSMQQAVLDLLLNHLSEYFSSYYTIDDRSITNRITGQSWQIADFADRPLDLAGRLVQEDLCLMTPGPSSYHLAAASVCFPSRWSLPEKLGQPLAAIHHPVPGYAERLQQPVNQVFDRLKLEYPGCRFNWSIVESPDLFLPPAAIGPSDPTAITATKITATNAGERLWFRVERQTLRRLPIGSAILFTIRTYVYPLHWLKQDAIVAHQLAAAIRQLPPATQQYKSLVAIRSVLLDYLAADENAG